MIYFIFLFLIYNSLLSKDGNFNKIEKNEFKQILDSLHLNGSILVFDSKENTYYSNDFDWSGTKFIPASTFKIPNSIIGLESGVITDTTIFKWDLKPRSFKIWEQDLNLKQAFQYSCVPCYQENARNIGNQRMKEYLQKLQYPGMVFDVKTLDKFWLEGESKISQFEQIDFLRRFYFNELPISQKTKNIINEILLIEEGEEYSFYGKTGWAIRVKEDVGWFVGYNEIKDNVIFYAINVKPLATINMEKFSKSRIEAAKKSLRALGIPCY